MKENKVVIIGCGNVGMSYAYSLVNQRNSIDSLYIIDINRTKLKGEVMDLNHTLPYSPSRMSIHAGTYKDCRDAAIVTICAGVPQNKGQTRIDLINDNNKILKEIVKNVMDNGFNGIFLLACNPVDAMSYLTWKYSGLPAKQVIGSGTVLDSARLKYIIAKKTRINSKSVHGYVIGEHGDSEFIPWNSIDIGLQSIDDFLTNDDKEKISEKVKNAAYEIINAKGNTSYGIGVCLARITNAILSDEHLVLPVSNYDKENDVFIGMPAVIGREGIIKRINLSLNKKDEDKLNHSISVIKDAIKSVK